jgi:hypothetical protein
VTEHHEAIDELLAGYALRSLSGPDAEEADRLLTEHVPGCATCRATLNAFGVVAAELALEPPSIRPPETLLPRLHREMEPHRAGRRRSSRLVAVAASVVLVIGIGGAALTQLGGKPTVAPADLANVVNMLANGGHATDLGEAHAQQISAPGVPKVYLYGDDFPKPPPGEVYRVWILTSTGATYVTDFVPGPDGIVVLEIPINPDDFRQLKLSLVPESSQTTAPYASTLPTAS